MIASSALQRAVYAALNGQITGTVHDELPSSTAKPYTVIGEMTDRPWDTHDSDGSEETATLHVFSGLQSSVQVKDIMAQIDSRLHHQPLVLSGASLVMLRREFTTVLKEEDPITHATVRHGVLRYRAFISE